MRKITDKDYEFNLNKYSYYCYDQDFDEYPLLWKLMNLTNENWNDKYIWTLVEGTFKGTHFYNCDGKTFETLESAIKHMIIEGREIFELPIEILPREAITILKHVTDLLRQ